MSLLKQDGIWHQPAEKVKTYLLQTPQRRGICGAPKPRADTHEIFIGLSLRALVPEELTLFLKEICPGLATVQGNLCSFCYLEAWLIQPQMLSQYWLNQKRWALGRGLGASGTKNPPYSTAALSAMRPSPCLLWGQWDDLCTYTIAPHLGSTCSPDLEESGFRFPLLTLFWTKLFLNSWGGYNGWALGNPHG